MKNSSAFERLQAKAIQWRVTLEETRERPTSLLGFGRRNDSGVVLKITKQHGDESHSGAVLRAFAGNGAVKVYECETGAVLLERLVPGYELVDLVRRGQDEEATGILAATIAKLSNHAPPNVCPTVAHWGQGFARYLKSADQQIPRALVNEARELFERLAASQHTTMLLHGDLQHYNVLFDAHRGWVAIDPKGVVGELEYEIGAALRNPVEQPELFTSRAVIERRLKTFVSLLKLDYRRTIEWAFGQSVLSAIWDVEDGYPVEKNHSSLQLAYSLGEIVTDWGLI